MHKFILALAFVMIPAGAAFAQYDLQPYPDCSGLNGSARANCFEEITQVYEINHAICQSQPTDAQRNECHEQNRDMRDAARG